MSLHTAVGCKIAAGLLLLVPALPLPAQKAASTNDPPKGFRAISFSGDLRARLEAPTGLSFKDGSNDVYTLTRARLQMRLRASKWLSGLVEIQDGHELGYNSPVPASVKDRVDLRQAWFRLGGSGESGFSLRGGRMPLKLGSGRMVWDPDWGNGTVFDGAHLSFAGAAGRIDAIGVLPVTPQDGRLNRRTPGVTLYGAMATLNTPAAVKVEPYLFLRRFDAPLRPAAETHSAWGARVYGRTALPALDKTNYELEVTGQSGTLRGAPLRAWGLVGSVNVAPFKHKLLPSLTATYTYATGDDNPQDNTRHTFQIFYPTVHLRTGATDRVGWSNIRDFLGEGRWALPRKLGFSSGFHLPRLDTVADSLYARTGSLVMTNTKATSPRIGTEIFALVDKEIDRHFSVGIGLAHLFAGPYLKQSGRGSVTQPYAFLSYKF